MPPIPSAETSGRTGPAGQRLARAEVAHEQRAAAVVEAEVVDREHPQAEGDLGADRVERGVERLLGDREVGDPDRHHPVLAPDEQGERRLERQDLEHAGSAERVVALQRRGGGVHEQLERRDLRMDARGHSRRVLVGELQPVGGVDLRLHLEGLDRGALEPQRLRLVRAVAAAGLHLQAARQGVGVVLQGDHAEQAAAGGVDLDEAALDESW